MLITNPGELRKFYADQRIWQGIPSVEVTKNGRVFVTFYAGGVKEEIGNYAMVVMSDDGVNFTEPVVVAYMDDYRCYDPCLWIDPLGRLWFTWSICPDDALFASICDNPDADVLQWGEPFKVGHDIMMNKPIVLTTGEWLFPLAVWGPGIRSLPPQFDSKTPEKGSFVYKTSDNGKTFVRLGRADVYKRHFDEHMVLELQDGRLWMLVRTFYGIGQAFSSDRGKTWSTDSDSGLGGPSSRFHICRLKSGRILLINHVDFDKRNNLMALLSEDDGKTWCARLMLDPRGEVSYPDVKEADHGYIYITYDRERGAYKKNMGEVYASAREILLARVTEADILAGEVRDPGSYLQRIVSKLGEYHGKDTNPFGEPQLYSDREFACKLLERRNNEEIIQSVFDAYPLKCWEQNISYQLKMDELIADFEDDSYGDCDKLTQIIALARTMAGHLEPMHPTVERIQKWVQQNVREDMNLTRMAGELGISRFYMCHLFKRCTGTTILDYRNELRLTIAKQELIGSDKKITEIAALCGFGSDSYFAEMFQNSEGISPSTYRKLHKK
ncbi:MAG: helix-turn-helix domain-containing protein [Ruminococcaceae bacterium]|nr:helix-turn-helix domain-containing protein [Oscillospiraceae bacterium]